MLLQGLEFVGELVVGKERPGKFPGLLVENVLPSSGSGLPCTNSVAAGSF